VGKSKGMRLIGRLDIDGRVLLNWILDNQHGRFLNWIIYLWVRKTGRVF
jgi:hypothetical protein